MSLASRTRDECIVYIQLSIKKEMGFCEEEDEDVLDVVTSHKFDGSSSIYRGHVKKQS